MATSPSTARAPRRRGRPRERDTIVVQVRIPAAVYDAYCRTALGADVPVRSVLRHILTLHAPTMTPKPS